MTRAIRLCLAALTVLVAESLASPGAAFPLFGRAGSAPCSGCHSSAPALNAYGERFLLAGDRAPGPPGRDDDRQPPGFSIVAETGAAFARTDTPGAGGARGARNTAEFRPYPLGAHSAGALTRTISYGLEARLDSAGGVLRAPVMFLQFEALRGRMLALKAGRFETGLPFLSSSRRTTRVPYLAPVAIAAEGIEALTSHAAWSAAAGLINSERSPAPAGNGSHAIDRLENTYAWAMRAWGGQQVGGRVLFARQASNISYHAWLQRLQVELAASLGTNRLRLQPAYVLDRFDDRPAPGIHQRHQYAVLEGLAVLDARGASAISLRLEHDHVTPTLFTPGDDRDLEAARGWRWVSPNVRLALEASHAAGAAGGRRETRLDATVTLAY